MVGDEVVVIDFLFGVVGVFKGEDCVFEGVLI